MNDIVYRRDIDGMRTLAVVPVVLFHAGLDVMPGGFVGVDVFFVISGFLITSLLLREAQAGSLSIVQFYERRVRRIAPALLLVLTTSLITGWFLLFPGQLISLAKTTIASEAFVSNIFFWKTSGYFRAQGDILPLLHTWSLAIEEQFYIFIPLLIAFLFRFKRTLVVLVLTGFVGSFILAIVGTSVSPGSTFYLLPTRAWELLCGSILAFGLIPPIRKAWVAKLSGLLGVAMIVAAILLLDKTSPFPGLNAALPCFGSMLAIHAGTHPANIAGKWLSAPILVFLGLISYPLYLWHWPVIVFLKQYNGAPLTAMTGTLAVGISITLAWATYRFVETPIRDRNLTTSRQIIWGAASAACLIALVSIIIIALNGAPHRFSKATLLIASGTEDHSMIARACRNNKENCALGEERHSSDFVLIGDSHAGAISEAIDAAARNVNRSGQLLQFNSCAPILGYRPIKGSTGDRDGCEIRNTVEFKRILSDDAIRTVILTANWHGYIGAFVSRDLQDTLDIIKKSGKEIVMLHNVPIPRFDLPWRSAIEMAHGRELVSYKYTPKYWYFEDLVLSEGVRVIDLSIPICKSQKNGSMLCQPTLKGYSTFSDSNHISRSASLSIYGPYLSELNVLGN